MVRALVASEVLHPFVGEPATSDTAPELLINPPMAMPEDPMDFAKPQTLELGEPILPEVQAMLDALQRHYQEFLEQEVQATANEFLADCSEQVDTSEEAFNTALAALLAIRVKFDAQTGSPLLFL